MDHVAKQRISYCMIWYIYFFFKEAKMVYIYVKRLGTRFT